ncbi:putative amidoligase enzyme-domain-containing protein [Hypoxylon crocopeplum]|nr:putative amidoligase enzyme-domain-containing protein [Hypoxylon crocopeplum]
MEYFTFGVELEAVYFYTTKSTKDTTNATGKDLAPVFDMSFDAMKARNPDLHKCEYWYGNAIEADMMAQVRNTIATFLATLPEISRGQVLPSVPDQYKDWQVVIDLSIKLDGMLSEDYDSLCWKGLEVVSPAMYATEASFKEVEAVTDMLRATFRTAVPPSCGLHVHVGAGTESFDLDTLKKMAILCWAGDQVLQQMHPVNRRYNDFCMGPRVLSKLANGFKAVDLNPTGEKALATTKRKVLIWQLALDHPSRSESQLDFIRTFQRCAHPTEASEEEQDACRNGCTVFFPDEPPQRNRNVGIIPGAKELWGCNGTYSVAALMSTGNRGAYNFDNYDRNNAKTLSKGSKKTVEFRQAAGSLDGHWVATYAKICVGIGRFARDFCDGTICRLVYDCYTAELEYGSYDVLDFIIDICLVEEAKVVQDRLKNGGAVSENLRIFSTSEGSCLTSAQKKLARMTIEK